LFFITFSFILCADIAERWFSGDEKDVSHGSSVPGRVFRLLFFLVPVLLLRFDWFAKMEKKVMVKKGSVLQLEDKCRIRR